MGWHVSHFLCQPGSLFVSLFVCLSDHFYFWLFLSICASPFVTRLVQRKCQWHHKKGKTINFCEESYEMPSHVNAFLYSETRGTPLFLFQLFCEGCSLLSKWQSDWCEIKAVHFFILCVHLSALHLSDSPFLSLCIFPVLFSLSVSQSASSFSLFFYLPFFWLSLIIPSQMAYLIVSPSQDVISIAVPLR